MVPKGSELGPPGQTILLSRHSESSVPELLTLECVVLRAIASDQPLGEVFLLLCLTIERLFPEASCSVLLVKDSRLHLAAAPSLPRDFVETMDHGVEIGPRGGCCGAAASSGQPSESHHIAADPAWADVSDLLVANGIRACWSSPVKSRGDQLLGTLAFYYGTCRGPSSLERRVAAVCIDLCALAIEHEEMRRCLRQTNSHLEAALSNMSQGICFYDASHRLVVFNKQFVSLYSLPSDRIYVGQTFLQVATAVAEAHGAESESPQKVWADRMALVATREPLTVLERLPDGRTVKIFVDPMPDGCWVATYEDVTERLLSEAKILHMARHDALTGLANRLSFQDNLERASKSLGTGIGWAVLYLDLDRFKVVNDTLGHDVGDKLLQMVADRLGSCVRDNDVVARLGGDEFSILIPQLEQRAVAGDLAEKIIGALRAPYRIDKYDVSVGASVGVFVASLVGISAHEALRNADIALYCAKGDGGGTYRFFDATMDARLRMGLSLGR